MNSTSSVSPFVLLCPIGATHDDQIDGVGIGHDEDTADGKMAMAKDPIVGVERVVFDDATGSGALPAKPLPSPKGMSAFQRAIHDLTHLPYDPSCEICVSCRRPNSHHKLVSDAERLVPLLVGDYAFPKHSDELDTLTVLVVRVYPYKIFMCCVVPSKGRDPAVVNRMERFIKECGLTHFTYRSDREPAITAMIDEAVSVSGRNGKMDNAATTSEAISHAQLVTGDGLVEDPNIDDEPHVEDSHTARSSHTAAPELTHPGESQSNGLAERSVGIFEDQFRTLKMALEMRIKHRLPSAHPVTAWLVEHTAWVLNKFHLGDDGRTAYGRLHGREGRERVCEFGETIMWYVPKKLRAKLDQRWRYGVFLGRALGSDQNYVGVNSGDVVCARAIIRVVPNARWSFERLSKIKISPIYFKPNTLDRIEESAEPQAHPEPVADAGDAAKQLRRLRVMDADVKRFGYTASCQRCVYLQRGQDALARGVRHNEECRERIYDELRKVGAEKIKRADLEDSARTQTKTRRPPDPEPPKLPAAEDMDMQPNLVDAPNADGVPDSTHIAVDPEDMHVPDDTHDFYREVDADHEEHGLHVDWRGDDLMDSDNDHVMTSMMDVLQTLGVSAGEANAYAVQALKDKSLRATTFGDAYQPTFFELYGHGTIVQASHGCRRNINIDGLHALDLRTCKPNGEAWDFSKAVDRRLARTMIDEMKPTWVVGSPPCTFFSAWNQGINHRKMDPERVEELRKQAIAHLHFVIGIYRMQLDGGRHFLHEHPAGATSWKDDWMMRLLQHPKVATVTSDQCEYGLLTPDAHGNPTPAKKPTRWMSSSPQMLKRLSRRCKGDHVHQHLVGGRAKAAEDYSLELVTDILRGMRDTADHEEEWGDANNKDLDTAMVNAGLLHDVRFSSLAAAYRAEDLKQETQNLSVRFKHFDGRISSSKLFFKDSYKDEYTNEELPIGHVKRAMAEELDYFCDRVWVGVPMDVARNDPDGKIIGSRWVNCNKNDINDPDVRCRLVAQEVNLHADDSFFAATPPLEAKRLLFSNFSSRALDEKLQISFVDVKKAYFYGIPDRTLYVRLPPELNMGKEVVGKLVRCMYGTRDAGAIWENCYSSCLVNMGFIQGVSSPCCFVHPEWHVMVVVHGDDFTAVGSPEALDKYETGMQKTFDCKLKGRLGRGLDDCKEMRVLNRIVRVTDQGVRYEADPRHAEMILKAFHLENGKSVVTPGLKLEDPDADPDKMDLDAAEEIQRIITSMKARPHVPTHVRFEPNVEKHDVPAYSSIYGRHPKTFDFDRSGRMVTIEPNANAYSAKASVTCPNSRRQILERTLRDGAAWELPTVEIINQVSKKGKQGKKFQKQRLGSKAAKHAERMDAGGDDLDDEAATMYRALSARILYLSMDRPEIAYAAKELCRHFAHPTKVGVEALKRVARFLLGLPRLVWHFPFQRRMDVLKVFVDTDFGGCGTTRRSTSGGVAMLGGHAIKHWSLTQTTIALSSGEAELGGICRGASIALGLQSLASDLGIQLKLEVLTDATAAIGICRRRGLGKIRHLAVSDLWVQDRVRKGDFLLTKIPGSENPADLLTKHVPREIMIKHMDFIGLRAEEGRAASAPTLQHT